jgi:hypothetical protein
MSAARRASIACGTSAGVGLMKEPVNTVTVAIDGIGQLTNNGFFGRLIGPFVRLEPRQRLMAVTKSPATALQ